VTLREFPISYLGYIIFESREIFSKSFHILEKGRGDIQLINRPANMSVSIQP
jgi:hypothetical protein